MDEIDKNCKRCVNNQNNEKFSIMRSKYWNVVLENRQEYLGRCLIILNNHKQELYQLSIEEWEDFGEVIKILELALKKSFNATMFNLTCLNNESYQNKPYLAHIHWYFRPRYDHTIHFADTVFVDTEFGRHYDRERKFMPPENILDRICHTIKNNL